MRILSIAVIILLSGSGGSSLAETQRTLLYDYDAAGNLVSVRVIEIGGAPSVNVIEPAFMRRDALVRFLATGQNLDQVQVSASDPAVLISDILYVDSEQVEFSAVTQSADLGPTDINFSNLLGATSKPITVGERLRIIATNPSPLIIAEGSTRSVSVRIDEPFDADKRFEVAVSDSLVVSVPNSNSFTLSAGQSEFEVLVSGLTIGNTQLIISQIDDSLVNTVAVKVLEAASLQPGAHITLSRAVGVRLQRITGIEGQIYTRPVGISRRVLVKAGESIESVPVGVELLTE